MPKKFYDIIPPEGAKRVDVLPEKKKEIHSKKIPLFVKGLVFGLAFLILVGAVGFFFFSKVEIEIWPKTDILSFQEKIILDLNAKQSNFEEKIIPAKIFSDERTASRDFPATGKILKKEKARGVIRVYNTYSASSRTLVPSRFVSADGKLFWSTKTITIPGFRYEKGKLVPGEIDVEVVAAEPGQDYNIGPSIFALPALAGTPLYTTIYGKSFSSMSGGFIGEVLQVSQDDLEKAKNVLTDDLKKESREFLKTSLPPEFVLLDETISQEILETNSSLKAGAQAESFNFQVKIKSEGVGFDKSELGNFAKNCLNLNISQQEKIQEESLELNYWPESKNLESGKIVLNLEIKVKVYSNIDLEGLKKALLGKSLKEAKLFLESLPEIVKIEIKSWSFLKRKISDDREKVEIRLNID